MSIQFFPENICEFVHELSNGQLEFIATSEIWNEPENTVHSLPRGVSRPGFPHRYRHGGKGVEDFSSAGTIASEKLGP
jgi:hypothetical protein